MALEIGATADERLRRVERILQTAETAYALARELNLEILQLRQGESGPRLTTVGYSLGICLGDAETAANRLGGLRNELQDLAEMLTRGATGK